jgi:DNA-directed RNA polymerase I subunit RPA1
MDEQLSEPDSDDGGAADDGEEAEGEAKRENKQHLSATEADRDDKRAVRVERQVGKGRKSANVTVDEGEEEGEEEDDSDIESDSDGSEGDDSDKAKAAPKPSKSSTSRMMTILSFSAKEQAKLNDLYMPRYSAHAEYDDKSLSLSISLEVEANRKRLMMVKLIEDKAAKCVVQELPGVNKCHVTDPPKHGPSDDWAVTTEGVNLDLLLLWQVNQRSLTPLALDLNRLRSNDVFRIAKVYGVEAARRALMEEISGVFRAYGIGVDLRHVSLICDSMMFAGEYRPLSRIGINHNASPLLKMSFETTCKFLTDAALTSDSDALTSPSARLILGRPVSATSLIS